MAKVIAMLLITLLLSLKAIAQVSVDSSRVRPSTVENMLEMLAEQENLSDEALSDLADNLIALLEDPINLNDTTPENLRRLPLSELQIMAVTEYIRNHGQMVTPYELQLVPSFDETLTEQLLPFIKTVPLESVRAAKRVFKSRVLTRYRRVFEKQKGYRSGIQNGYLGSPDALLVKAKITASRKIQLGITAEKDAGEEFFKGNNAQGFDFYSGYLALSRIGVIKQLIIGDFSANFGQGLTLSSGYSLGKASLMVSPEKHRPTVTPYSSTDENRFFRGVAATSIDRKITLTAFASRKHIDASVDSDSAEFVQGIESIQATGSHATNIEMKNKHSVMESTIGFNASYSKNQLRVGTSCFALAISKDFIQPTNPYQLQDADPTNIVRFGADFLYYRKQATFFGEFAMDKRFATASITGVSLLLAPAFNASLIGRRYENNYPYRYAGGFGEGSKTSGEKGICIALEFTPYKRWRVSAYADLFEFTWLRYRVSAPSSGTELSATANYSPSKTLALQLGLSQNNRPFDVTLDNLSQLEQTTRTRAKIQLTFAPAEAVTAKTRLEATRFERETAPTENGVVILQDITWHNPSNRFSVSGRVAFYRTDGWNSRVYAYENDVLYSFTVPAYYLSGSRYYLLTSYSLTSACKVWIKWSNTLFFGKNEVGSGLSAINGNSKSDIKVQLLLRF